jgi:hypothetical protein
MDVAATLSHPGRTWHAAPAASEAQIRELAARAPAPLPRELLDLLRFSNGGEGELGFAPYWFVLDPVEEIIRALWEPLDPAQYEGFVFVGGSGGMELIALDCRGSAEPWPVVSIDPIAGLESAARIAPDFRSFVEALGLGDD